MAGSLKSSAAAEDSMPEWEVEYSRFFHFPIWNSSSQSPPTGLRPLPMGRFRSSGTWLAASSPAVLLIFNTDDYVSLPALSVSVSGVVHEEHLLANLCFSWPQTSCLSDCPIKGSRVVFLSYRDRSNLIQKFGVRFPTSCAAETFLNFVKECSRATLDFGIPESGLVSENSSSSEFMASNGIYNRICDESKYEEPVAPCTLKVPDLTHNSEQSEHPLQLPVATNTDSMFSGFPPTFSDLLNSCLSDSEKEQTSQVRSTVLTDLASHNEGQIPNPVSQETFGNQSKLMEEVDLKSQIAKYMSDNKFNDMLSDIEMVINELGGDLAL